MTQTNSHTHSEDKAQLMKGRFRLTPREEQTVNPVTEGLNNCEIARHPNLKENTAKKSLLRIYDKVGVSNHAELVLYALSHWQERQPQPVQQAERVQEEQAS